MFVRLLDNEPPLGLGVTVALGFRIRRAFPMFRIPDVLALARGESKPTANDCLVTGVVIGCSR